MLKYNKHFRIVLFVILSPFGPSDLSEERLSCPGSKQALLPWIPMTSRGESIDIIPLRRMWLFDLTRFYSFGSEAMLPWKI